MPFSQIFPPSPSPTESIRLFYRIDVFELWCWRRLLRVPWTARRSNQSILKEISPGISLERMMLKLKLQYFGHLIQRVDSGSKRAYAIPKSAAPRAPVPVAVRCWPLPLQETFKHSSVSVSVGSLERSWRLERLLNLKRGKTNHIDPLSIQHCGASYELELYGRDHSRHAGWFFQWGSRRSESDDHMHLGRRC